jgi:NAD(P)-dependent dehydrogenase (short-subunit alcohol dehydrogenase family)
MGHRRRSVRYAATEFGHRGIRVNGIRIGTVMSEMARDLYNAPVSASNLPAKFRSVALGSQKIWPTL